MPAAIAADVPSSIPVPPHPRCCLTLLIPSASPQWGTPCTEAPKKPSSTPSAPPRGIQGRFPLPFASPSYVRRCVWQEQCSLLILAPGSPPRQLEGCGKPGSTEVRAGRCLQTARTPRLIISLWWAGGRSWALPSRGHSTAPPGPAARGCSCPGRSPAIWAANPKSLRGSHVPHILTEFLD